MAPAVQRVDAMGEGGYVRYDESTARMLSQAVDLLIERYEGDLRNLRKEARRDPAEERKLLKQFKGIGEVGADIFFRDAQLAWPELYPFVDKKARAGARKFSLPTDDKRLAGLVQLQGKPGEIKAEAKAA